MMISGYFRTVELSCIIFSMCKSSVFELIKPPSVSREAKSDFLLVLVTIILTLLLILSLHSHFYSKPNLEFWVDEPWDCSRFQYNWSLKRPLSMELRCHDLPWQQVNKEQCLHFIPVELEILIPVIVDHDIYLKNTWEERGVNKLTLLHFIQHACLIHHLHDLNLL